MLNLNGSRRDWWRAYLAVVGYSSAVLAVFALLFTASQAHAGEIEPRAYVNTPVGVNFLIAAYSYSDGDLSTTAASPIKDAHLKIETGLLAYARSLDVWGDSGKVGCCFSLREAKT